MNISTLRSKIDKVDLKLLTILAKRASIVKKIGKYKRSHNIPPLDSSRWQQVLESRTNWAQELDLDPIFISGIFELMHKYSLQIEEKLS